MTTKKDPQAPPEFTESQIRWLEEMFTIPPVLDLQRIASPDFAVHHAYAAGQASVPVKVRTCVENLRLQRSREKTDA
ncbi:MAG TPA: hypothetical protein VJ997_14965 [Longimicrobiales bacterium]|nr:hypothetical protein [Longimicrobiales bacterium]